MARLSQVCTKLLRHVFGCAACFAVWSLWTLLLAALALQTWIAWRHEVVLPSPVTHLLERRLGGTAFQVTVGRVAFDPLGHVVVRDVAVGIPGLEGPVVRAAQIETQIDPWTLLAGHVEVHQLAVSGAELLYPSQLSPTGRPEAIVSNLDAVLGLEGNRLSVESLSARAGSIALFAHGRVALAPLRTARPGAPRLDAARAAAAFTSFLRHAARFTPRLEAVRKARIDLTLYPSPVAGAVVDAELSAAGLHLETPRPAELGPFHAEVRIPLAGRISARVIARAGADSVDVAGARVAGVDTRLVATWNPHDRTFVPLRADVSAVGIQFMDTEVDAIAATARPGPAQSIDFAAVAGAAGARVAVSGSGIPARRSGTLAFDAVVGNGVTALVSGRVHKDLSRFVDFAQPGRAAGTATFLPGGKLQSAQAWVDAHDLTAHAVHLDRVFGHVWFDGHTFRADHAVVRQGGNVARGTYEMDVKTHDFRFLLTGFLRPLDITGWFKPWWPKLWANFAFPTTTPAADVDVQGRWKFPALTRVFAGVDAPGAVVRKVPFNVVRTRVYVDGHVTHVISVDARRPEGTITGWFKTTVDAEKHQWEAVDFDMTTHVDLAQCAGLLKNVAPEILAPYSFEKAPALHARGHVTSAIAPGGKSEDVAFDVTAPGRFAFRDFPLHDVAFSGLYHNRHIEVPDFTATYAGGQARAAFSVDPHGTQRAVKIRASLAGAKLGEVVQSVEAYAARVRKQSGLPKTSKEERMSNARLDATVDADGILNDPTSFHGSGTAELSGPELGHVRLLGGLSELLRFTSLRFTSAKTQFKLAGPLIDFQSVRVTGHNSAIDAHGTYSLKTKQLDFKAQVWPFEQSQGLVRGTFGLVLSPLTVFLEVKLGGTLADPSWSFLYSPFRMLTEPDTSDLRPPAAKPPIPDPAKPKIP